MTATEKQILSTFPADEREKIAWIELIGSTIEIYYNDGSIKEVQIWS